VSQIIRDRLKKAMPRQVPKIAGPGNGRLIGAVPQLIGRICLAPGRGRQPLDPQIYLADRETRGLEIEIELDGGQVAQDLAQEPIIPARGLGEAICV